MSPKYKMVCLDLDGTLLNSKNKISEQTLSTLREVEKRGIKIVVVTGRAGFDAKRHAEMISKDAYFIGSNGAVSGSVSDDKLIHENPFSGTVLTEILTWANEMNINPVLYSNKKIFVTGFREYLMHLYYAKKMKLDTNRYLSFKSKKKWKMSMWNQSDMKIHKIVFFAIRSKKMNYFESILRKHKKIEMALTGKGCFELTDKGINKSYGIKILSEYFGIDKTEIIAFGDSENDLEMIKYVGCGVAMQNATSQVKAISDRITASNDDEGVSIMLKEMLEKNEFA
ncbi:Cof-type HAD-IIB family hydrolase [Fusibacter ferrireducens]|uniref:HAD family phosphatase n=1 Tax=Fusibacter ferrireducens TaxID=2785058 RepID=A0ABR9ZWL1_9FIRM|nr:Cof-type HAD-IIB family hydrolase [Fusibacter ferrireducens]MBF4694850.1 HAD family phosphatase [Fusibacter ferrireducens]